MREGSGVTLKALKLGWPSDQFELSAITASHWAFVPPEIWRAATDGAEGFKPQAEWLPSASPWKNQTGSEAIFPAVAGPNGQSLRGLRVVEASYVPPDVAVMDGER